MCSICAFIVLLLGKIFKVILYFESTLGLEPWGIGNFENQDRTHCPLHYLYWWNVFIWFGVNINLMSKSSSMHNKYADTSQWISLGAVLMAQFISVLIIKDGLKLHEMWFFFPFGKVERGTYFIFSSLLAIFKSLAWTFLWVKMIHKDEYPVVQIESTWPVSCCQLPKI